MGKISSPRRHRGGGESDLFKRETEQRYTSVDAGAKMSDVAPDGGADHLGAHCSGLRTCCVVCESMRERAFFIDDSKNADANRPRFLEGTTWAPHLGYRPLHSPCRHLPRQALQEERPTGSNSHHDSALRARCFARAMKSRVAVGCGPQIRTE